MLKLLVYFGLLVLIGISFDTCQAFVNRFSIFRPIIGNYLRFKSATFKLFLLFDLLHNCSFLRFDPVIGKIVKELLLLLFAVCLRPRWSLHGVECLLWDWVMIFKTTISSFILILTLSSLRFNLALWLDWSTTSISHIVTLGTLLIMVFHLLNTSIHFNNSNMAEFCALFPLTEKTYRNIFGRSELLSFVLIRHKSAVFCLIC